MTLPMIPMEGDDRIPVARHHLYERRRILRRDRNGHYTCLGCGITYLMNNHSREAQAGLCKVCYHERRRLLECDCPRIRGDQDSVYACELCPEYTGNVPVRDQAQVQQLIRGVCMALGIHSRSRRKKPVEKLESLEV